MISSSDKKLIFDKLLNLLLEFKRVCDENNLNYSLYGGTLLGAVRGNGFIPWDDDVDVCMPREDFNALNKLALENDLFREPYFLQSPDSDKGSPRLFMRLRDSSTTSISSRDFLYKMNHGIFIDIFPIDYFPKGKLKKRILMKKNSFLYRLSGGYARYYSGVKSKGDSFLKKMEIILLYPFYKTGVITSQKCFAKLNKSMLKYNQDNSDEMIDTVWMIFDSSSHFPKEFFGDKYYEEHLFENYKFKIISTYDSVLKFWYGDYMVPRKDPTGHGDLIQRVDIPYDEFIKNNLDSLVGMWRK